MTTIKITTSDAVVWSLVFFQVLTVQGIIAIMILFVPESVFFLVFGTHELSMLAGEYIRIRAGTMFGIAYITLRMIITGRQHLKIVLESLIVVDVIEIVALFFGLARLSSRTTYWVILAYEFIVLIFHSGVLIREKRHKTVSDDTDEDSDSVSVV